MNVDIETVETQDLIDELRRRSKVFFCARRPLVGDPLEYFYSWGVEGGAIEQLPEGLARVVGLVEICKFELLTTREEDDDDGDH